MLIYHIYENTPSPSPPNLHLRFLSLLLLPLSLALEFSESKQVYKACANAEPCFRRDFDMYKQDLINEGVRE